MFEDIRTDLKKLIAAYEKADSENRKLKAQLADSEKKMDAYKEQIIELNNQIDNLSLKAAFTSQSSDNSEAKAKIAKMIKEIDKCISLMER